MEKVESFVFSAHVAETSFLGHQYHIALHIQRLAQKSFLPKIFPYYKKIHNFCPISFKLTHSRAGNFDHVSVRLGKNRGFFYQRVIFHWGRTIFGPVSLLLEYDSHKTISRACDEILLPHKLLPAANIPHWCD